MTVTHLDPRTLRPGFPLSREEREALIKALYVVQDNWWLTDVEARVLARLVAHDRAERRRSLLARRVS
jgi:hypothetical protein